MDSIEDYNRIYWHSRRGMLELDLVLLTFMEHHFRDLSDEDKCRYVKLLTSEDQDMFQWFLKHKVPEDEELAAIVNLILKKNAEGPLLSE